MSDALTPARVVEDAPLSIDLAEKAIAAAIAEIDRLRADERLTQARFLLTRAADRLDDFRFDKPMRGPVSGAFG
jgi:hypothetical protein